MTATPTPGDLSARHVEVLREMFAAAANERRMKEADALDYAIAALSALPAAGGSKVCPKCMGRGKRDIAHGETTDCAPCKGTGIVSATPQPSAAEGGGYNSPAQERLARRVLEKHEGTLRNLADAAVGAQGDGDAVEHAVDRFLAWPLPKDFGPDCGISFTPLGHPNGWPSGTNLLTAAQAKAMFQHCLAAPAAGKGVDDTAALAEFTEYFVKNYPGPHTIISDPNWHAPRIFRAAKRALSALTRQPVAGDGGQATKDAFHDGVILALQVLTSGGDMGNAHYVELVNCCGLDELVKRAKAEGMLKLSGLSDYRRRESKRAAPAATPTDGGEGSNAR